MRLQSAIFDMDGTLINSMEMWRFLGENFLRSRGLEPRERFWEDVAVETIDDAAAYYQKAYCLPGTAAEIAAEMARQVEDFYAHRVQVRAGVEKFLTLLRMEGVSMYVATNTDRPLTEAALRHTGLDPFFQGLLTCAEVGSRKSQSAEIFERAMRRLRSNKRNTVIFEDSLPAIRTAKRAGFRVAGVYEPLFLRDQAEIEALSDYYIRSFEEFVDVTSLV